MNNARELPFSRTIQHAFQVVFWLFRFSGRLKPDDLPDIIVSRKFGLVCAGIPLCGTRSLKNFFRLNESVDFGERMLRDTITNVLRSEGFRDPPLIFTAVRDPWSRVVSCYEKKIRGAYIKSSYKGVRGISILARHDGLRTSMTFDSFVDWLCSESGRDEIADRHWMSQYRFLSLSEMDLSSLTILRLHSLEKDLNALLGHVGLPYQPLQKVNSSATTVSGRLHVRTKDYYTEKTIAAVAMRYERDIDLFGFEYRG